LATAFFSTPRTTLYDHKTKKKKRKSEKGDEWLKNEKATGIQMSFLPVHAAHSNRGRALLHSLLGVLDLKKKLNRHVLLESSPLRLFSTI
jgi:hypothetical protein